MSGSNRLDWTIYKKFAWVAKHYNGTVLVARTKTELMKKINLFDKERS